MTHTVRGLRDPESLNPIFRPNSIAIIGASSSQEKLGFKVLKNILDAGFEGPVFPINPKAEEILGVRCYRSVKDIERDVDLAVVIIPAPAVAGAIEECGQKGIKGAIVITGGFRETGPKGEELERAMIEAAANWGLRVIGPNCQGVNHPHHGLCASWPLIKEKGEVAIISQSGTVGAAFMDWASMDKLGFSAFVSLGNRADVDEADLVYYLSQDENTRVIALYLEGVKDGPKFMEAARACQKPIVVLKPGKTEEGKRAAESHTKALAGRDEIYEGVFRQVGIHRARDLEELYDFSKALAYLKRPQGRRVLIVTSSGGSGVLATDIAAMEGLDVSPLPEALATKLRAELPSHFVISNPFDLTGDAEAGLYKKVIEVASPHYDALFLIFGDPLPGVSEIVGKEPPQVVVYLGGAEVERREKELFHLRKVPVFPTPERGVRALSQLVKLKGGRDLINTLIARALEKGRNLTEPEACKLLKAFGIPVVEHAFTSSEEGTVEAASTIGFPVALKVVSLEIIHKSDAGGVFLNLQNPEEVRASYHRLIKNVKEYKKDAFIEGVLVSKMAQPGIEVILGMVRDPQFGPAIMFGLGGIFVEVYKDVSFRILPITEKDVLEMIQEIKGFPLLKGMRGQAPRDMDSIVRCALNLARLVQENPEIQEIDLNPIRVYERGCEVLDARILLDIRGKG